MPEIEHYPAKTTPELWKLLKPLARQMRHEPTTAEDRLWERIRNRRVNNLKFRRQHAIERFIVDFYCAEARLIIEVDGEVHQYSQEEDAVRQEYLEGLGLKVIRFTNNEIANQLEDSVQKIVRSINKNPSTFEEGPG